jgi:hypothetical protein
MLFKPVPKDTTESDALRLGEATLSGRHARYISGRKRSELIYAAAARSVAYNATQAMAGEQQPN